MDAEVIAPSGQVREPVAAPVAKRRPGIRRFDRLVRLVQEVGFERLQRSHVVVFGLGGVGGFAAEGLVRSGIGRITLVDFDVVCATNVNRQLQAVQGAVGKSKAELLAARLRSINPQARVDAVRQFYSPATCEQLVPAVDKPTWVVDAIDSLASKAHLLDRCRILGIPVVSSMGAAGKLDPTSIRVGDLYESRADPLARMLRKTLRRKYGWPAGKLRGPQPASGVTVVYSLESRRLPIAPSWDGPAGHECICPDDEFAIDLCGHRALIEGSAVFVTSVFGMAAASAIVRDIVGDLAAPTLDERDRLGRLACAGAEDEDADEEEAAPQPAR